MLAHEFSVIRENDEERWLATTARRVRDEAANTERLIGVVRDITERRKQDEEVEERQQALAHLARVATMGELSTTIVHELGQPVGAVTLNAETARLLIERNRAWVGGDASRFAVLHELIDDIVRDSRRAETVIAPAPTPHAPRAARSRAGEHRDRRVRGARSRARRAAQARHRGRVGGERRRARRRRQPGPDASGAAQHHPQRARRDGERPHGCATAARDAAARAVRGDRARPDRRHRHGHRRGSARRGVRAVRHVEGARRRARPRDQPHDHGRSRRRPARRERRRRSRAASHAARDGQGARTAGCPRRRLEPTSGPPGLRRPDGIRRRRCVREPTESQRASDPRPGALRRGRRSAAPSSAAGSAGRA